MLHLIFSERGIDRIRDILRPTDQVVQLSSERIVMVDVRAYLDAVAANPAAAATVEPQGEVIDQSRLAAIISDAPAIKSTY